MYSQDSAGSRAPAPLAIDRAAQDMASPRGLPGSPAASSSSSSQRKTMSPLASSPSPRGGLPPAVNTLGAHSGSVQQLSPITTIVSAVDLSLNLTSNSAYSAYRNSGMNGANGTTTAHTAGGNPAGSAANGLLSPNSNNNNNKNNQQHVSPLNSTSTASANSATSGAPITTLLEVGSRNVFKKTLLGKYGRISIGRPAMTVDVATGKMTNPASASASANAAVPRRGSGATFLSPNFGNSTGSPSASSATSATSAGSMVSGVSQPGFGLEINAELNLSNDSKDSDSQSFDLNIFSPFVQRVQGNIFLYDYSSGIKDAPNFVSFPMSRESSKDSHLSANSNSPLRGSAQNYSSASPARSPLGQNLTSPSGRRKNSAGQLGLSDDESYQLEEMGSNKNSGFMKRNPNSPSKQHQGQSSGTVPSSSSDVSVFINDSGSKSGTFLNGIRLSRRGQKSRAYELFDGDIIQFGQCSESNSSSNSNGHSPQPLSAISPGIHPTTVDSPPVLIVSLRRYVDIITRSPTGEIYDIPPSPIAVIADLPGVNNGAVQHPHKNVSFGKDTTLDSNKVTIIKSENVTELRHKQRNQIANSRGLNTSESNLALLAGDGHDNADDDYDDSDFHHHQPDITRKPIKSALSHHSHNYDDKSKSKDNREYVNKIKSSDTSIADLDNHHYNHSHNGLEPESFPNYDHHHEHHTSVSTPRQRKYRRVLELDLKTHKWSPVGEIKVFPKSYQHLSDLVAQIGTSVMGSQRTYKIVFSPKTGSASSVSGTSSAPVSHENQRHHSVQDSHVFQSSSASSYTRPTAKDTVGGGSGLSISTNMGTSSAGSSSSNYYSRNRRGSASMTSSPLNSGINGGVNSLVLDNLPILANGSSRLHNNANGGSKSASGSVNGTTASSAIDTAYHGSSRRGSDSSRSNPFTAQARKQSVTLQQQQQQQQQQFAANGLEPIEINNSNQRGYYGPITSGGGEAHIGLLSSASTNLSGVPFTANSTDTGSASLYSFDADGNHVHHQQSLNSVGEMDPFHGASASDTHYASARRSESIATSLSSRGNY